MFGVAVAVVVALIVTWVVAILLQDSQYSPLDRSLQQSRIVRALDAVLPPSPPSSPAWSGSSPRTASPSCSPGSPQTAAPVNLPTDASARAAVLRAEGSTVQVAGAGCGVIQEGSGFVAAPGLVVTNAHVVAGIRAPYVIDSTGRHATSVALFDPRLDIAVLRVHGLTDPVLPVDAAVVARGTTGVVLGYPGGGPLTPRKAGVAAAFHAVGLDIYGSSQTTREIYQLDAVVQPATRAVPWWRRVTPASPTAPPSASCSRGSTSNPNVGYALAMPAVNADVVAPRPRADGGHRQLHLLGPGPAPTRSAR